MQGTDPASGAQFRRAVGLTARVTGSVWDDRVPAGAVSGTRPAAGASVPAGTAVALVVSKGVRTVRLPAVVGQGRDDAAAALTKAGLALGADLQRSSKRVAGTVGKVVDAAGDKVAAGRVLPAGTVLRLVVSTGPSDS